MDKKKPLQIDECCSDVDTNTMSLANQIEIILKKMEFNYTCEENSGAFSFDVEMESTRMTVRLGSSEEEMCVMAFAEAPFGIPKEKYYTVLSKINKIHMEEFSIAHLFINEDSSHLMAQSIVSMGSVALDDETFRDLLLSPCYLIDSHFNEIMQVIVSENLIDLKMAKEPYRELN